MIYLIVYFIYHLYMCIFFMLIEKNYQANIIREITLKK